MDLQPASVKVGGGVGADDQTEAVQRRFEVLYLDESARVVRFLPDADSDSEPQLFVFEREGAESLMEEVRSPCRPLCQRKLPSSAQYAYWLRVVLSFALCETKAKGPFGMRPRMATGSMMRDPLALQEEEEDDEAEEDEGAPAFAFFGGRGQQGLATQAERSFKAQKPGPKRGTRQIRQQPAK